jgi:hypothetical protein
MQKYFWGNNHDKSFSWNFLKTIAKIEGFWTRFTKFRVYGLANHQTSTWLQSFLLSYLSCSQIWLDPLLDGSQCGYTTKVKKKTLRITCWWYMFRQYHGYQFPQVFYLCIRVDYGIPNVMYQSHTNLEYNVKVGFCTKTLLPKRLEASFSQLYMINLNKSKPMSNLKKICKKIINMSMYWKSWYS